MTEILTESNTVSRAINPVSGILGNVSGSTWLTEQIVNISAFDGHSNGEEVVEVSLTVEPAQATGRSFGPRPKTLTVTQSKAPLWS